MHILIEAFESNRRWTLFAATVLLIGFGVTCSSLFTSSHITTQHFLTIAFSVFTNLLPGYFLFRYSSAVTAAVNDDSDDPAEKLEKACLCQARYFQLVGIMYAIILVLIVGGAVLGIGIGASGIH